MKVLILNPILYTSDNKGALPKVKTIKDTMIYGMCKGFLQLGHEVTLIAADDFKPTEEENYEFEIIFMPAKCKKVFKPNLLPFMPGVYSYLSQNKNNFDVIVSSEVFSFTSLFASLISKPKTVIWHELTAHNRLFKKIPSLIWYNFVARFMMNNVKVVPRSEQANKFISQYCCNTQAINVDHGIDLSKFKISSQKKKQFISISQLIPRKNVDIIISKFSQFIKEDGCTDYKLYIAGRGDLLNDLQEQVKQLGITDNVCFLGFVDHDKLNEILSESQALLLNTSRDLNVVSISESLASGTPVITNSVPALSGFIKQNTLGLVNDDWNVAEMKEVIQNTCYKNNCLAMREEFSNTNAASKILYCFNQQK